MFKGEKIKIKDCNIGDFISLSENEINLEHMNIIVPLSVTLEYLDKGKDYAFNVISLKDGRVRTFHPESEVYVFYRENILK